MAESFLAAAAQRASDVATFSLLEMWTVALAELKPAPPPEVKHADVAFGCRWKLHTSRPTQGEQFFCEALKTAFEATDDATDKVTDEATQSQIFANVSHLPRDTSMDGWGGTPKHFPPKLQADQSKHEGVWIE